MRRIVRQIIKRGGAAVLAATMTINLLPGSIYAANGNLNVRNDVYQIEDAEDLVEFARLVNEGGQTDLNATLEADIDLANVDKWTAIGADEYSGTFDGHNHTISLGEDAIEGYIGIFNYLTGTVQNLKVEGSVTSDEDPVGGIVAWVDGATIKKCSSTVTITSDGSGMIGGVAGAVSCGSETVFTQCSNYGTINAESAFTVGGIIGYMESYDGDGELNISYCTNQADLIGGDYVGGMVGYDSTYGNTTLTACYSTATGDVVPGIDYLDKNALEGDCAGELFGGGIPAENINRVGILSDGIDGEGSISGTELDGEWCYIHQYSDSSMEDFLTMLNGDEDPVIFVQRDGEGWPILAWELEASQSSGEVEEQEKLKTAKEDAVSDIQAEYDKDTQAVATRQEQLEISGIWYLYADQVKTALVQAQTDLNTQKEEALAEIEAGTSVGEVTSVKNSRLAAMQNTTDTAVQYQVETGISEDKVWDGTTSVKPAGDGTEAYPYQISSGAELAWFAQAVNNGQTQISAVLTSDIDLGGHAWTPIYQAMTGNGYQGTFDGANHIIHRMNITALYEDKVYTGLFGYIGSKGTVQNVKVAGTISSEHRNGTGAIAGYSRGVIYNCIGSAYQTNGKYHMSPSGFGGIVGRQNGGITDTCEHHGMLRNDGGVSNSGINNIGGIVGTLSGAGLVRYCTNDADIIILEKTYSTGSGDSMGGIVGSISGSGIIRECENNGTIAGRDYIGGILGSGSTDKKEDLQITVEYVVNNGAVNGDPGINEYYGGTGGIIGLVGWRKIASSNSIAKGAEINNAYNTGLIQTCDRVGNDNHLVYDPKGKRCGGLIGNWLGGTVKDSECSTTANRLWGYASAEETDIINATKTGTITGYTSTRNSGASGQMKITATQELQSKLIAANNKVYGEQYVVYNGIIYRYIRKVESAGSDEEIRQYLQEVDQELSAVPSELAAAQYQLKMDLEEYVNAHIYDEQTEKELLACIADAEVQIDQASTVKQVTTLRQSYLGTENTDGRLAEYETYDSKAVRELYDEFIYDKEYSTEDLAALIYEYQGWVIKIQEADSREALELAYANGRSALSKLSKTLQAGNGQGDLAEAEALALTQAQEQAAADMETLVQDRQAALQLLRDAALISEDSPWKDVLDDSLEEGCRMIQDSYTIDFLTLTDRQMIETKLQEQKEAVEAAYIQAEEELQRLVAAAQAAKESAWDGESVETPKGSGTEQDPYQISTGAQMAWLAKTVNERNVQEETHAILMNDIDLGCREWTPIGKVYEAYNYSSCYYGSFDGQGYTIYGLKITQASVRQESGVGLFGTTRGATIKNLTVQGSIALGKQDAVCYVGGIAGYVMMGTQTVTNCNSYVNISAETQSGNAADGSHYGGVVGYCYGNKITINGCIYDGTMNIGSTTTWSIKGVGGIIGYAGHYNDAIVVTQNLNLGTITVTRGCGTGGIVGYIEGTGTIEKPSTVVVEECVNQGPITCDVANAMDRQGGTGGIVGIANGSRGTVMIQDCSNTGTIYGSKMLGGILGSERDSKVAEDKPENLSGCPGLTIQNCYNAGLIKGPNNQGASQMGGIAGYPVEGSYRIGLYVAEDTVNKAMGYKCSQGDAARRVSSSEILSVFGQKEGVESSFAGLNQGYPVYRWQVLADKNRKTIVSYLEDYCTENLTGYVTPEEKAQIDEALREQIQIIRDKESSYEQVYSAYQNAMALMNPETLLREKKAVMLSELENKKEQYITAYPMIKSGIELETETIRQRIDQAKTPAEVSAIMQSYGAGIVDLLIQNIGTIDREMTGEQAAAVKNRLDLADAAYNALSLEERQAVTRYMTLAAAKQRYQEYLSGQAEQAAIRKVIEAIEAIGTVTEQSGDQINYAKQLYNQLTDAQKGQLSKEIRLALIQAIQSYNRLMEAKNKAPNEGTTANGSVEPVQAELPSAATDRTVSDGIRQLQDRVNEVQDTGDIVVDEPYAVTDMGDNQPKEEITEGDLGTGGVVQEQKNQNWLRMILIVLGILAMLAVILGLTGWFMKAQKQKRK